MPGQGDLILGWTRKFARDQRLRNRESGESSESLKIQRRFYQLMFQVPSGLGGESSLMIPKMRG